MKTKIVLILSFCFLFLFGCNGSCQQKSTVIFKSDYCNLNNEKEYSNGSEVNLTLTVKEEYSSYYVIPDDVYVLIGEKEGINGSDYTFVTDKNNNKATLSFKATGNVFISAFYKDSDNVFRVGADELNKAVNFEGIEYVQSDYVYTYYSTVSVQIIESIDYLSPTVNYRDAVNLTALKYSASSYESIMYQHNLGDRLDVYTYNEETKKYDISQDDVNNFIKPQKLPIVNLVGLAKLKYEQIKDKFDVNKKAYCFEITNDKGIKYDVTINFREGKIEKLSYYTYDETTERGDYGNCLLTYNTLTPTLPTNVTA